MPRKGLLIAIEGIDGAGKTTQARLLREYLQSRGYCVVLSKEPTEGPWGRKIRTLAREGRHRATPQQELEYFIRDRQSHVQDVVLPALQRGCIVILDRYYFSTMAYQGASGLDPQAIRRRNEAFAPAPDLLIVLDVPPSLGRSRIRHGRNETPNAFEGEDFLARVRALFRNLSDPCAVHVDGTRSIQEVQETIRCAVDRLLAESRRDEGPAAMNSGITER